MFKLDDEFNVTGLKDDNLPSGFNLTCNFLLVFILKLQYDIVKVITVHYLYK